MGLLLNLGWVLVPSDHVAARHYFLEQLNRPEYIWGIRAVFMMTAVLLFFLYQKLKGNMKTVEAAVSGEVMAADDSSADIDNVPVIEINFASVSTSAPAPVSTMETVAIEEPEPVSAPETVSVMESVSTPEQESEPVLEDAPIMENVPELETLPEPEYITEHTPKREAEIKPAGKPGAVSKLPGPDVESNIWLWALVGVSVSIGGIVLLSIYRRKRRVA